MDPKDLAQRLKSVASLDDPVRRRLYLYVAEQEGDVSRDQAARALQISRALAAFHLDRLVKSGLLETTYRRLSGRSGPGAGRPSKLYRRAALRLDLTLPPRRYELAAQVLGTTLAAMGPESGKPVLRTTARERGRRLAEEPSVGGGSGSALQRATHALSVCGFEPRLTPAGEVVLRNCPFESLRSGNGLVCDMNLALIEGLLDGLELDEVEARLVPREGMCCVTLRDRPSAAG
jgi:predicted ArsR family transcriptional regulator